MPKFGAESLVQLRTCHPDLIRVMNRAVLYFDFKVIEGFRDKAKQDAAFASGLSQKRWPYGEHNQEPSRAVDVAPWPVDWSSKPTALERFVYLAGHIMLVAKLESVGLRWGGDWNRDQDTRDEHFRDYGHFELWSPK